jgi:hypothetical protein
MLLVLDPTDVYWTEIGVNYPMARGLVSVLCRVHSIAAAD